MKRFLVIFGIVIFFFVLIGTGLVRSYNRLVGLSQNVESQWAQVQNVYQRRADLIPNLVKTVEGSADFEKSTLIAVTEARASVGKIQINSAEALQNSEKFAEFEKAQQGLSSALSRLLVVVERYPELKANRNFVELQAQLEGTENRISVERGRFNEVVQAYNTFIKQFPTVFYAGALGFKERPYFQAAVQAQEAPKVDFHFNGK